MKNQREIKFRVWDKEEKGMITSWLTGLKLWVKEPENYIPLQFTGLKDKNGKEIYEGDILEDKDWGIGIVGWNNFDAQWVLECQCDYTALHFVIEQGAIILGNTMENPELLK